MWAGIEDIISIAAFAAWFQSGRKMSLGELMKVAINILRGWSKGRQVTPRN